MPTVLRLSSSIRTTSASLAALALVVSACSNSAPSGQSSGTSTGGKPITGGTIYSGGTVSTGGTMTSGGMPSMGGAMDSGGAVATGGIVNTGGMRSTGGMNTGGDVATGGAPATGGKTGSGGDLSTGGAKGSGGNPASGGASGSGGSGPTPNTSAPIGFATLNGGTSGGKGGKIVTAKSFSELASYASSNDPLIIMVDGTISNGSGGGIVNVNSNKSIIGIGSTAFLDRVVISIKNHSNIILQNLKISLFGHSNPTSLNDGDNISISGSSKNIWIDHCELYSDDPAKQTNIDFYDGLIDIKNSSGYITVSWNYAHDHHKGFLVGSAASDLYAERKITYHHNYFARVRKRTPTYRGAVGHVFNNYVTGADQATFAMTGTCLRVERNYYEQQVVQKYSIFTNSEEPGKAEIIENFIDGGNRRDFPPACKADIPYPYDDVLIKNVADVKAIVMAGAGVGKI